MRRSTRPSMANEILFDTSGFFALINERDRMHNKAVAWIDAQRRRIRPVSTEWVVGETCTLLVARKRPHLVARFLNYVESSAALLLVNPDDMLLRAAKAMIRQQAEQSSSIAERTSFCLMQAPPLPNPSN